MQEVLKKASSFDDRKNERHYFNFLVLEAPLLDNLASMRSFGADSSSRADQAHIVDALNQIAFEVLGKSFVSLCRSDSLYTDFAATFKRIRKQIPIEDKQSHLDLAILEFRLLRTILDRREFRSSSNTQADKQRIRSIVNELAKRWLGQEIHESG